MKKLQEDKDIEILEIRHRRQKRILMERIRELKDFVRSLKVIAVYIHPTAVLLVAFVFGLLQDHVNENSLHFQHFLDMDMRADKFVHMLNRKK